MFICTNKLHLAVEKVLPIHPNFSSVSSSSKSIHLSLALSNDNSIHPWSPLSTTKESAPLLGEEPRGPTPNKRTRARKTSIYRGVTRHKWTGRYEAHLWDKGWWDAKRNKKGRQVYLGAFKIEEDAAHAYDVAALKYWGLNAIINFPVETYANEFRQMQTLSTTQVLASIRRRSSGFSRGASRYRGVARHRRSGRWEARISLVNGNKYFHLGTFDTEEMAAQAYDIACIKHRRPRAITNFDVNLYVRRPPQGTPLQLFPLLTAQPLLQPSCFPQTPLQKLHPSPINLAPLATTNAPVNVSHDPVDAAMYKDVFKSFPWDLPTEKPFDQCDTDAVASADEADGMLHELFNNDLFSANMLREPELNDAGGVKGVTDHDGCNIQDVPDEGSS